jgi:hypothetical protein
MTRRPSLRSIVETIDRQTRLTGDVISQMNAKAEQTLAHTGTIAGELEADVSAEATVQPSAPASATVPGQTDAPGQFTLPEEHQKLKGEIVKQVIEEITPLLQILEKLIEEQKALKTADPMVDALRSNLVNRIEARRGAMMGPRT